MLSLTNRRKLTLHVSDNYFIEERWMILWRLLSPCCDPRQLFCLRHMVFIQVSVFTQLRVPCPLCNSYMQKPGSSVKYDPHFTTIPREIFFFLNEFHLPGEAMTKIRFSWFSITLCKSRGKKSLLDLWIKGNRLKSANS